MGFGRCAGGIEAASDQCLVSPHAVALLPAHGEGEAYRRSMRGVD